MMKYKIYRRTVLSMALMGTLLLSACPRSQQAQEVQLPKIAAPEVFAKMIQRTDRLNEADALGWVNEVLVSLDTIKVERTNDAACAVMAVIEQESGYKEDPPVAGLSKLLNNKIKQMQSNVAVRLALNARLDQTMSDGKTFRENIAKIKTERDLANWYSEFTAAKYLGPILSQFGKGVDDVVGTVGSMQVSIDYARDVASSLGKSSANMRDQLYTRSGGVLFGTSHLLNYPSNYDQMIYRFADYNAGHYASRNAGFQAMLAKLTGKKVVTDGDLIRYDEANPEELSQTQAVVLDLFAKKASNISPQTVAQDLALEKSIDFEKSTTYMTVVQLYSAKHGAPIAHKIPTISLKSEKITRKLTTEWYANSVNRRYQQCMATAQRAM